MTAVIPFEYCANVTDIINYLECSGVSWKGNSWQLFHFNQAFKSFDAPKSNLKKPYHSSYVKGQTTNLALLKAAYRDVAASINVQQSLRCLERASNAKMPDRQEVTGINKLSEQKSKAKLSQVFQKTTHDMGKLVCQKIFCFLVKCAILFQQSFHALFFIC